MLRFVKVRNVIKPDIGNYLRKPKITIRKEALQGVKCNTSTFCYICIIDEKPITKGFHQKPCFNPHNMVT